MYMFENFDSGWIRGNPSLNQTFLGFLNNEQFCV